MKQFIIIILFFIYGCSSTKHSVKEDKELQAIVDSVNKKVREIKNQNSIYTREFWKNGKLIYSYRIENGDTIWIKKPE